MSVKAKLLQYLRNRDRGFQLALMAAAGLLYMPFLGSPFIFDDLNFFASNVAGYYARSWFNLDMRWFPYATLGWTQAAFSDVLTHFYHLGNLLLHIANTILLFFLLRRLFEDIEPGEDSPAKSWGAWFGAALFAVHPVAVYAVGYVIQRSILMATLFTLLMQFAYLRGLVTGRWRWLALAVAAYFMAVFSKEHSVMMPAVLVAMTVLLRNNRQLGWSGVLATWCAFLLVGLLIALRQQGVWGSPYEPMAQALFENQGVATSVQNLHLLSVLTQSGLFFKYLFLWFLPNPAWMSIDMREPFVSSLTEWRGWIGLIGFVAYGVFATSLLLKGGRKGLAGLALLYPWLQFLVEFSTIRVQEPFVLYRSYLWMPMLALFVPLLTRQFDSRRTWLVLIIVVTLFFAGAANRLWVFASHYRLWQDAASLLADEKAAGADRIYFNRGQALAGMGRRVEAIDDFKRSLAISPQYAPVHFELGWQYGMLGRFPEAMIEFDAAIANDPKYGNAYYGKGMLHKMRHEDKLAAEMMEKSCELKNLIACMIVGKTVENRR